MNHDQSQRDAVASSHGRNARKRPRPKISIVGLQISAPPEHQFHKPRLESSEGLVLFDFSRKPSWEDFTKVATAGTAKDSVVVPIIANENRRFESTAESGEQSNSKAVASSRIATMATADNRQGSDFVGTRNAAVNEPSSLSKEREQIATKSRRESRLKKVHGALVSCSESDSTLEVVSPVSTATLERRNSAHSIGVVHLSETYVATPGLPTVLDIEENSEQGRKSSGSTTANYVEEIDLLSRLDRDISLAEEEDLLHRLDREISLEEEENIMKKLDEDIKKAEVATKTNTIAVSSEMNVSSAPSNDDKTNRSVTDGEVTLLHRMINHTHQQIQKAAAQLSSQKVGEVLRQDSLSSQGEKTVTRKTRVTTGNAAPPNSKLAVDRRVSLKESLHRELKDGGLAFTEEDFNSTFMKGFRREIERDDPSKLVDFEYTIRPSLANKQLVYDLVAKGESSVIVALRSKSKAWVKYRTIMAKINQIVNDGYSKVLDIYARPEHFGIIVMVSGGNLSKELLDHEERGAFFENRNPPGRVATMLGPKATKKGVAIIAADDMCIGSSSDLQVYLQQKEVEGAFVKLTFCMHRNIDLSQGSSPLSSIRRMRDEKRPLRTLTEKLHANKNTNDRQPVENTSPGDSDVLEYPPAGYVLTSALPKSPPSAELGIDDAVSQILENDRSVEVELLMPVAGALGAKLYFKGIKSSGFLHHFSPEGALARTLGKEFSNWGAVLSAVNGAIIRNASDFKEAKQKVGNVGTYRLRLLCYDGIDLSGVDRTRLACPPRRQNGEKYPLHLHVKGGNSLASHGDRSNGPAFMARSISTMSATDKKNVLAESNRDGEGRNANVAILSKHIDQSSISDNKETESMTSRGKHASPPRTSQGGVQNSKTGRVGEVLMEEDPPENTGKKTIYLPYRMKSFGDHDFFSEEQFQMEFMEIFLDEIRKKDPTKVHSLEYSLTRDRARPDKYKFVASGDIATVDELMKRAMAWNRFISATTKLDIIFKDPSSIIAEFNVKTTHSLGFSFLNVRNLSNEHRRQLDYDHPGLWFGISDNEGMIVQKLGREVCSIVAALVAIDGILITREYQVQQLLSQDTTSELAITVCVHKDTPLDRYNQGVKFRLLKETVFFDALRGFPETKRLRSHHAISGEVNSFLEHPPPGFVPTSALPTVPPTNENEFGKVIEKLLKDERSVEIELLLPTNVPLGAQLCYPPKTKGVGWLHRFRPGSTIADIFGNAFGDWGAAVLSINGKKTYSVSHFQTEKGKTKNGEIFRLKLLCFDGVDLSDVDRSKIFNPPRRLNGQKYPMHLHPKISISSDSGTKGAFDASSNIMHQTEKRKIDVSSPNHHEMKKARKSTDVYDGIHGEFPKMLLGPSIPKKTASESNNPLLIAAMDVDRLPSKGGIEQDISGDSSSLDNDSDFATLSPRKRKALNSSASSLVPQSKLQRTESQTRSIQAKGNGTSAMSNAFDKTFRTNRPLGAYFVTERVDGRNVCKVRSVHVGGQAFREKSIREGTLVDSVVIGTRRNPIRTSKQLRSLYEKAKKLRSGLTLVFKNPEATTMKDLTAVDKGWSHNGHWEGGGLGGWAGGADDAWANDPEKRDLRPLSGSATPQTTSPTHNDSTDVGVNSLSSKTTRDNILAVGDEITIDTHLEFPSESPVLRRRRSVTFGPSRAKIIEPRGSQDKQPDPINEIPTPSSFLRLLDAVQNKTCQELINVLESGASQDAEVVEKGLQECYNEVKKKIIATKRDTETESTSKAFDDLNAKRKVLNFYVNSTLLLEKALNLEHWGSFELRVLNSDVRFLDSTSRPTSAGLMVCGNIRVGSSLPSQGGKMEKLGDLKPQLFSEFIIWDVAVHSKVKFTNNPYILEPRQLQIELFTYAGDDQNRKTEFLCMFQIPLTIISDGCPNYEPPVAIEIPVLLPNDKVKSGELTVEVQRVRTDHNYVRRKSDEVAFKLSEQLDFIARFNQDYKDELVLAPNIQGRNGKSLLHAAVHLRKLSLIKKLADLGAKFSSSTGESENPLTKATNQRDRAEKKLQEKLKDGDVDENAIRAYRDSLAEFEAIVDILTKMAYNPLAP